MTANHCQRWPTVTNDDTMRALIFLLALLLPLQLSWAAMAGYCQAEQDRTPSHLAHHEHAADKAGKADNAEKQDAPPSSPSGDCDAGCSLCHFSCMKPMQLRSAAMATPSGTQQKALPPRSHHPASHIADGPDKPNWTLAA
ncbi:cobalt transporter [Herbaspirillum robiniae]|uniref:cobalt transporter n=1 Tax=Herbaspirillum robiniae TaxID=2014887 RepID=UPI003D76C014